MLDDLLPDETSFSCKSCDISLHVSPALAAAFKVYFGATVTRIRGIGKNDCIVLPPPLAEEQRPSLPENASCQRFYPAPNMQS